MSIQSVERAVGILKVLAASSRRMSLTEVSSALGLAKTTVHGLLKTLHEQGFVEQDTESGKYQIGHALLELGTRYLDVSELRRRSLVWADLLAQRSGESVRVAVLRSGSALIVHHVFRPDNSLQILEVGTHRPLHATALGKALLAHQPGLVEELGDPLSRLTQHTTTKRGALVAELRTVLEQGYATEREEAVLAEAGVAAPIFDHQGVVIGAIGINGALEGLFRRSEPHRRLTDLVTEAARSISRELLSGRLVAHWTVVGRVVSFYPSGWACSKGEASPFSGARTGRSIQWAEGSSPVIFPCAVFTDFSWRAGAGRSLPNHTDSG